MKAIDADAHVIETEETWSFLSPSERRFRPRLVASESDPSRQSWVIDGKPRGFRFPTLTEKDLEQRARRTGRSADAPQASREMSDVGLRLRDMDRLGIDIQVLHNTIFIEQLTDRPEIDVALCGSWNRWLAQIWKQSDDRLRWSMVPPLLSIPDALDQIREARQNGAVAVLMRPMEGHRILVDPYFYPIFEEAQKLDMAIAVHIANANPDVVSLLRSPYDPGATFALFRAPTVVACHELLMSEIPQVFPTLRWGFIEASAQWVPWIEHEARFRWQAQGRELPENLFEACRVYVTCQTDDDLPYVAKYAGENNLVIGTDYGHFDTSTEVDAITVFRESSPLPKDVIEKVLVANPARLYGLTGASAS
jgi:predicted TIM-barrel fold metal-dependent hydrolase